MTNCSKAKFDPTKPVQTIKGLKARIICTDRKGSYPIIALVENEQGEMVFGYDSDGVNMAMSGVTLINIPEVTRQYRCVSKNGTHSAWVRDSVESVKKELADMRHSWFGISEFVYTDGELTAINFIKL